MVGAVTPRVTALQHFPSMGLKWLLEGDICLWPRQSRCLGGAERQRKVNSQTGICSLASSEEPVGRIQPVRGIYGTLLTWAQPEWSRITDGNKLGSSTLISGLSQPRGVI